MTPIRRVLARLILLLLSAALIAGAAGLRSAGAVDLYAPSVAADGMPTEDTHHCCEPEPQASKGCALACAPSLCALMMSPLPAAATPPLDRRMVRWRMGMMIPDGISPETSPPPPRS